jgi:Fe2+ transport system protein FeoA
MIPEFERTISLDQLPEEGWATVAGVTVPTDAAERTLVLRLLELGFVPGERVHVVREGRSGRDPLAIRLGHTTFALRRREAAFIQVIPSA